ncbi:MAG: twin-arginine translocation signal domain-containing protein [Stygiobacter sp.]|nr:MAG: acetylgalactosaminidase [Stygiobacter sp. GWC2_38_9]OGV08797.1 MAG: acetylgalactosaminidase [Stygiobacter sp. RIFOXYB2_FULL_37_11]OGV15463.1 MAG: acetylgalactosaminidase [Stygiobacter sp. RIFOXYC2_FULL_38_25]OGV15878.1 MAG: acetylgalactosaminidase [Stygiobacter sp. RIFOXYA2_FULL_38_8]OGV80577.1 MAG: acetylgalactosaminidase [Stygiobacter sp. GWF2_38_21]RJQ61190.1 MAG: twin-arginine translocation signal domain-containing protein [Stygiobacter sp.]
MSTSRRDFLKTSLMTGAAIGLSNIPTLGNDLASLQAPSTKNKNVVGLACEPIPKVRIGFIGLGMRGPDAVDRMMKIEGVEIKALGDLMPERVKAVNELVKKAGRPEAIEFSGSEDAWKKMCERDDIDLIYSCTPWLLHTPIAVYAMKHGKHAAIEVPIAVSLKECWELVDTAEQTRRHCMMLENCCYDFFEMATLNMARNGVLGEIIHAECAYLHDLRWLKFDKEKGYQGMWRLNYSEKHTGNPYPTHGLGPVAQVMDINRGDRMEYLTSMSTNQFGMSQYAANKFGKDSADAKQTYKLGDMNTTLVRTAKGHTIMIQHDTTSPRPYSRIHLLSGTKGIAQKWPAQKIALEPKPHEWLKEDEYKKLMTLYEHPLAKKIGEKAREVGGHGGMDFIMDYRLIHCLRNGLPLDQDVYDGATWSSIVELSELSVKNKSKSIEVPDFTRGAWKTTKPIEIIS